MDRKVIGSGETKVLPKVEDYLAEIVSLGKRYGMQLLGTTEDGDMIVHVRDELHKTALCERCGATFMPAYICPKCGAPTTGEHSTAEGDDWVLGAVATPEVAEHFAVEPVVSA